MSILENEPFLDIMLKKAHYATFKKEIIIELQKSVEGIFKSGLEQSKAKSEKTPSDSHALYHEQIQLLKDPCKAKDVMISKLLETIEDLSSNKNYNNCNTTTTNIMPLIQQQLQIMGDRLMSYQAFQLNSNYMK